jgi:hypothetical protein
MQVPLKVVDVQNGDASAVTQNRRSLRKINNSVKTDLLLENFMIIPLVI